VDLLGFEIPANPTRLDVDDAARTNVERFAGNLGGKDRFVETNWRAHHLGELSV
jgi:hypothetical protein